MSNLADPNIVVSKTDEGIYVTIDFPIVSDEGYESTASYTLCMENVTTDDPDGDFVEAYVTLHDNQQFDEAHYRNVLPEFQMKEND